MDFKDIFKALIVVFIIGNLECEATTISVDFNHQNLVREGTNVTYTCRAEPLEGTDPGDVQISIYKRFGEKRTESIMVLNGAKTGIYKELERYVAHKYSEGDVQIHELKILGVREEDSGTIACVDPIEGSVASASFMVYSDIETVYFLGMDKNLTVSHEDEVNITCVIKSSIPEAMAHIHADDHDYTDIFHKTVNAIVVEPENQPPYIDYDTIYMASTFKARPDDDGKELTCTAHVPGVKGMFDPKIASVKLEVSGPPVFFDCEEKRYALLHQKDVMLNCAVRYNPIGSANWTFMWDNQDVILGPNNSTKDGEIISRLLREPEGHNVHKMVLEFKEVKEKHFQTYTLSAENLFGRGDKKITLFEGEPSNSETVMANTLLTLALALMTWFSWF